MIINSIKLNNFRCFDNKNVCFDKKRNLIYGPNATGKTSILESVYLLSLTKSYRATEQTEVIKNGCDTFFVQGEIESSSNIKQKVTFGGSRTNKKISVNNYTYPKFSSYIGYFNVVDFSANDFLIINKSPQERRRLFDVIICQLSQFYVNNVNLYKNILKMRNSALKQLNFAQNESILNLISVYNKQLSDLAKNIIKERISTINQLNLIAKDIHKKISNNKEELEIEYLTINNNLSLEDQLKNTINEDIKKGYTQIGPHHDDYIFKINGLDISKFASQGQQRNALLSIKLAVAELINNIKKEPPVILLDDVFSELDKDRQNKLIECLNQNFQTIITAASIADLNKELIEQSKIINIIEGEF